MRMPSCPPSLGSGRPVAQTAAQNDPSSLQSTMEQSFHLQIIYLLMQKTTNISISITQKDPTRFFRDASFNFWLSLASDNIKNSLDKFFNLLSMDFGHWYSANVLYPSQVSSHLWIEVNSIARLYRRAQPKDSIFYYYFYLISASIAQYRTIIENGQVVRL